MTLLASLGALCAVAAFWSVATAAGLTVLRLLRVSLADTLTRVLTGTGLGVVLWCLLLNMVQAGTRTGAHPKFWVMISLSVLAVLGASEYGQLIRALQTDLEGMGQRSGVEKLLCAACGLVLVFEGLSAAAPLTGSDALHYHFAAPLIALSEGFHPNFFLAHSFLTGQSHLLIWAGLALGSEKLALGLVFLGGVLATAATYCLARNWTRGVWPWVASLVFLLTPVVFWQIAGAGAPDIWMAFWGTMGVLLIAEVEPGTLSTVALTAGVFAGAIAAAKYTGIFMAAALAIALMRQSRSLRQIALFFMGAIGAGIWPYWRNWWWTGDPLFPFLGQVFRHVHDNPFALAAIRADTGGTGLHINVHLVTMPLFAAFDAVHAGFWQFFGPVCLMLAPVVVLCLRNTALWRTAILVWLVSSLLIAGTSGMTRFLLPVYPIAVAAALAGAERLHSSNWRQAKWIANASITLFLLMGAGGLALYGRQAVKASIGMISREDYLSQRAPDFAKSEFLNAALSARGPGSRALVFFRHLYYLRVPYVYGDPQGSWAVDPAQLNSAAAWHDFLYRENIHWVVRSPDYPASIAAPLHELEATGGLLPVIHRTVSDIEGMRMQGRRSEVEITILCVAKNMENNPNGCALR